MLLWGDPCLTIEELVYGLWKGIFDIIPEVHQACTAWSDSIAHPDRVLTTKITALWNTRNTQLSFFVVLIGSTSSLFTLYCFPRVYNVFEKRSLSLSLSSAGAAEWTFLSSHSFCDKLWLETVWSHCAPLGFSLRSTITAPSTRTHTHAHTCAHTHSFVLLCL